MAQLCIKCNVASVYIIGEFCNWDINKAIHAKLKPNSDAIYVEDLPAGEYKVLCCKEYRGEEKYPTNGRPNKANRYFNGIEDEKIHCYF